MKVFRSKFAVLALGLCLAACSRRAEKTALKDAPLVLGPINQDAVISVEPKTLTALRESLKFESELNTASYLRFAEDLNALGTQTQSEELDRFSKELFQAYRSRFKKETPLSESLYAQALLGEAQPEVKKEVDILAKDLRGATLILDKILEKSKSQFSWPRSYKNFSQVVVTADAYLKWLNENLAKEGLKNEVLQPIGAAINKEYQEYRPKVIDGANRLERTETLRQAVAALRSTISNLGIEADGEVGAQLAKAKHLVNSLEEMETSHDALVLIIYLWKMVPEEDRKAVFYKASPEIYNFLADRGDYSLDCLQQDICLNPILELARQFAIYPKIEEYGIDKLRDQIDTAARKYIISAILQQAAAFGPRVPDFAKKQLYAQAGKYQDLVATIRNDFAGFAAAALQNWEKKEFPVNMRGLDPSRIRVKIMGKGKNQVALKNPTETGIESGAEVLGASISAAQYYLPTEKFELRAALVEPLVKMFAVSGFTKIDGTQFPSFLLPLDGKKTEVFKIRELLEGTTSFAVPDAFVASKNFVMNRDLAKPNASVSAQAELLRGISKEIAMLRDWNESTFDSSLSNIPVEELVKGIPKGAVNLSAFPKEILFTISVATAGSILQNVIRDLSPAFLFLPDGNLIWGKDYKQIGDGPANLSAVAGLVNIENGKRGSVVKTADVARYVLALDEFLRATDGIEQTKSKQLRKVDGKGKSVLDKLTEARRYLKLMQMALVNYLVFVAQDKDGGFHGQFTLEGKNLKPEGTRSLEDQVLAIRALTATAKSLELPPFLWSALDCYYFLNRNMWNSGTQFYSARVDEKGQRSGQPNVLEITATLRSLNELSDIMDMEVKEQWDRISKPWQEALESL